MADDDERDAMLKREERIVRLAFQSIEQHEEFRPHPVIGNDGEARLGWFWKINRRPISPELAKAQTLSECYELIRKHLRSRFWQLPNLNDVRASVLVHAALAIGPEKIINNADLWNSLRTQNYELAHDLLLRTDWPALAAGSERERARILTFAREMRTGERTVQ